MIRIGDSMRQFIHLRNTGEFLRVYKTGNSLANKYLVMYILPNQTSENRLGISVSKKIGNSVVRHRITRLVREVYRLDQDQLNGGFDIVVVARVGAKGRKYSDIESAFLHLCKKHHIMKEV
jgi:ribonuclease P protein component